MTCLQNRREGKTITTQSMSQSSTVLSGKRNIVEIEDKSDISEDYEKDDRIPPFIVNKDPSIQLNDEDTPWLRCDHNQGIYVKKKFTTVPA